MSTIFEERSNRVFTGEGVNGLFNDALIVRVPNDGEDGKRSWYLIERDGRLSRIYEHGSGAPSTALVQLLDVLCERGELREVYVTEK